MRYDVAPATAVHASPTEVMAGSGRTSYACLSSRRSVRGGVTSLDIEHVAFIRAGGDGDRQVIRVREQVPFRLRPGVRSVDTTRDRRRVRERLA
jgi:hypothetical protein